MNDLRFHRLERYRVGGTEDEMHLAVPVPFTSSGKTYQFSPNEDAAPRLFLIGDPPADRSIPEESWPRMRRPPGPGDTVCPYSGFRGPDEAFVHCEDINAVKEQIIWAAGEDLGDYLAEMVSDFNRRQPRNGLISIGMEVKRPRHTRPAPYREDLLRNLECDICRRPYGVYAIALFCPDCGGPNLAVHFRQETQLVRDQIAIAGEQDKAGSRELAYRLMGNAHEDVLTAFETALKTVYRYLARQHRPDQAAELTSRKLAFQNIGRIREHFSAFSIDPFSMVAATDLEFLTLNIQKRHIIGHNLSIADEHYLEFAQEEQPGETVPLLSNEIARFAECCLKVVTHLECWLLPSARLKRMGDIG